MKTNWKLELLKLSSAAGLYVQLENKVEAVRAFYAIAGIMPIDLSAALMAKARLLDSQIDIIRTFERVTNRSEGRWIVA